MIQAIGVVVKFRDISSSRFFETTNEIRSIGKMLSEIADGIECWNLTINGLWHPTKERFEPKKIIKIKSDDKEDKIVLSGRKRELIYFGDNSAACNVTEFSHTETKKIIFFVKAWPFHTRDEKFHSVFKVEAEIGTKIEKITTICETGKAPEAELVWKNLRRKVIPYELLEE